MFTCMSCSKQLDGNGSPREGKHAREDDDSFESETPRTKQAVKALTSQIKDIAIKASGAYKNCKPCPTSGHNRKYTDSDDASESARFHYSYRRTGNSSSTPRSWRKEMETRLPGLSSGDCTPASQSSRIDQVVFVEEGEPKEWVAQVEPGVLITFVSLPSGGNDLKRIRFSREMFNKWQAQRWWSENYDKVMELYNVRQLSHQDGPLQTPSRSEDEPESVKQSPATPPLEGELRPPTKGYSSSDSQEHHRRSAPQPPQPPARAEDHSGELSVSNASEAETEWVEQDEPGVYITIRLLSDGTRELRRVRFSRERFGETHARLWWEENRARIQQQYL